jgi:hypothetical protein
VADRRPLTTLGKIDEIPSLDRLQVEGIVRALAGDLTFTDAVTGTKTLAELAAASGGTILGTTPATANRFVTSTGTLNTVAATATATIDSSSNVAGLGTVSCGALTVTGGITATTTIAATGAITGSNLSGTNTGNQTITLTGDVTGSGTGSFAATIAADAVTYAKMQNASAASILLGRGAGAGAGDLQEVTLGTNLSMTGAVLNAATGGSGEANTSSNAGASGTGIALAKSGVDLPFAKILGTNGIAESLAASVLSVSGVALLPRDGSRAMTGALDMSTQPMTALGYRVISDTIAAQQDNYAPTSWNTSDTLRITLTGTQTVTGFTAPTAGGTTRKIIENIDSADALTIAHESVSSTAANRVTCPGGASLTVPFGASVILDYDSTSSRWRPASLGTPSGEANTASNLGATGTGLFSSKSGVDLQFFKIDGVNGLSESVISNVLTLDATLLLPRDGSRAMTAALDMGGFGLVSLGYNTISPTAIAAGQNDYSPTSWSGADIVRLTFTGSQTITGFSATATAVAKIIENIDTVDTLTIAHESASSSAANRVTCPNAVALVIPPGGSVRLVYDITSTRWRPTVVNNGAVYAPPFILHKVRRSAQLTNVTGTVFPGYDTTLLALNATYWSYSSGSWTCVKAHTAEIRTSMSYKVNSGAVSAIAGSDIVQGSGGSYTNNLQSHKDSSYSTTDTNGHLTNNAIRAWAVNEQFRVYYYADAGAIDILAAMNDCTVYWVSDT